MVIFFLANGFEEIEALAPIDLLRRAGVDVLTVAVKLQGVFVAHLICVGHSRLNTARKSYVYGHVDIVIASCLAYLKRIVL